MNTLFFQVPSLEFGYGARVEGLDLVLGHKGGHWVPVCTQFCKFQAVHCFVLGVKLVLKWRLTERNGVTDVHRQSKCEHNTILCWYPGTDSPSTKCGQPLSAQAIVAGNRHRDKISAWVRVFTLVHRRSVLGHYARAPVWTLPKRIQEDFFVNWTN